jgi:intein-encoded DNA endonuclease-like protein
MPRYHIKKWTKPLIIKELKKFSKRYGDTFTSRELLKINRSLFNACKYHFGSLNNARKVANLRTWNKGKVNKLALSAYKLTKELGYIIGVILGDGNITENEVRLRVTDNEFALHFKKQIEEWSGLPATISMINKGKGRQLQYKVALYSVEAVRLLKEKLKPIKGSRRTYIYSNLDWILKAPFYFQKQVFKGFFDSEGYIYHRNKTIKICLTNTNIKTLEIMKIIGNRIGLKNGKIAPSGNGFQLTFQGQRNFLTFYKKIGVTISRKISKELKEDMKKWENKTKLYKLAIKLRKKYGVSKISKILGIPKTTLEGWFYNGKKPFSLH